MICEKCYNKGYTATRYLSRRRLQVVLCDCPAGKRMREWLDKARDTSTDSVEIEKWLTKHGY